MEAINPSSEKAAAVFFVNRNGRFHSRTFLVLRTSPTYCHMSPSGQQFPASSGQFPVMVSSCRRQVSSFWRSQEEVFTLWGWTGGREQGPESLVSAITQQQVTSQAAALF